MAILVQKDLLDARGNKLPENVQIALTSSAKALLSGTPSDTEKARKDWNALKGQDSMLFREAFQKIKEKLSKGDQVPPMVRAALGNSTYVNSDKPITKENSKMAQQSPPTKGKVDPVKAAVEAKAAEKKSGMSDETKAKLKAAKEQKVKEPKPEIQYTWNRKHEDVGVKVYTGHGVGVVRAFDDINASYLVYIESTETEKVVSKKGVHHKAFPEQYREKYEVDKSTRTASGAFSISTGDDVAKAMNALNVEQLADVAERAGLEEKFATWAERNPGMQRMNLGNCIRGLLRKEDTQVKATAAVVYAAKLPRLYTKPEPKPKPVKEEVQATNIQKKVTEAETGKKAPIAGKQNGPPVVGTKKK